MEKETKFKEEDENVHYLKKEAETDTEAGFAEQKKAFLDWISDAKEKGYISEEEFTKKYNAVLAVNFDSKRREQSMTMPMLATPMKKQEKKAKAAKNVRIDYEAVYKRAPALPMPASAFEKVATPKKNCKSGCLEEAFKLGAILALVVLIGSCKSCRNTEQEEKESKTIKVAEKIQPHYAFCAQRQR